MRYPGAVSVSRMAASMLLKQGRRRRRVGCHICSSLAMQSLGAPVQLGDHKLAMPERLGTGEPPVDLSLIHI